MFEIKDIFPDQNLIKNTDLGHLYHLKRKVFHAYIDESIRIKDEYEKHSKKLSDDYYASMTAIDVEIENKKQHINS